MKKFLTLFCFAITLQFSLKSQVLNREKSANTPLSHGKFLDINDTCHTIFYDGNHFVRYQMCYSKGYKPEIFSDDDLYGKFGVCGDTLTNIVIDTFNKNIKEYILTGMTQQGKECERMTVISNDSFWIITPLKTRPNIRSHYTTNNIMIKREYYKDFKIPMIKPLELIIEESNRDSIIYIAFDQKNPYNKLDSFLNMLYIPSSGLVKTNIRATPYLLAYNAIKAFVLIDGKKVEVPIIFEKFTNTKLGLTRIEKEKRKEYIESNKSIFFNDKYFVLMSRYNPDRERTVNRVFREKIEEQVLDLELMSLEKYINGF